MKEGIHPALYDVTAQCLCGATFELKSTRESLRMDICSQCHPFCTGSQKFVDEAGRIEKFQARYKKTSKK